jgi:hypothetical protein
MRCKSCSSESQQEFRAEMIVHFPGLDGLDKPIVWVFPKLLACMNCGFTEFAIPETELAVLASGMLRKSEASRPQESAEDGTQRDLRSRSNRSDSGGGGSEMTG